MKPFIRNYKRFSYRNGWSAIDLLFSLGIAAAVLFAWLAYTGDINEVTRTANDIWRHVVRYFSW